MLDAVEPIVMPEKDTVACPSCGTAYTPKRSNQRYCSRSCQKNASRDSRKVENKHRSRQHYERASRLTEMIYSTPPQERGAMMEHILSFIPHDAGLRNILTDPELHMKPPRADNRLNISKAANAYTQKFFGLSIKRYIASVQSPNEPAGIPVAT